ncbi:MAG TPA: TolC family protein [Candidatus Acidoferrum sp.]|nr:TolC family protein [Candidatus Acidoferrum sp.]
MKMFVVTIIVLAACVVSPRSAQSASTDSITVQQAVELTLKNHPAIRQAEFGVTASSAHVDASHSDKYPDLSVDGKYVRIGPVPQFDLPGEGPLELAPHNNYDFHVGLKQTLYDFGKNDATIRLAETSHQTASDYVDLVKFNLAYQTIGVFNNILILHQRIAVLDEQLQTLSQHLDISVKKINAGTATDFDTLTIQVRIAVVRSDRIDALHALETQEIMFRQLTGLPPETPIALSGNFVADTVALNPDSLVTAAGNQRPELVLSRDAEAGAQSQSHLMSLGDKPLLSLNVATGFANGFEPNLNTWKGNYAAGLELKIPVFNGYRTKRRVEEADANLNSARAHSTDLERQILSEVRQAIAGVNSSQEKIASTETQVRQAEQAVSMARVRYNAGVITNLDLLDAETSLSQTKLIRVRALYDYTVSLNALDRATGKRPW